MTLSDSGAEERTQQGQRRLDAAGMRFLTGGLTSEGDTFLIAAAAVLLMGLLYPLISGWALLAFPVVLVSAVVARRQIGRR